jgi:hypothetical protein
MAAPFQPSHLHSKDKIIGDEHGVLFQDTVEIVHSLLLIFYYKAIMVRSSCKEVWEMQLTSGHPSVQLIPEIF